MCIVALFRRAGNRDACEVRSGQRWTRGRIALSSAAMTQETKVSPVLIGAAVVGVAVAGWMVWRTMHPAVEGEVSQPAASVASQPGATGSVAKPPAGPPIAANGGAMRRVPGGTFKMGAEGFGPDELPIHSVTVATFELDETEVSVAAYKGCVDAGKCLPSDTGGTCNWGRSDRAKHPINCVDYEMSASFCAWAGKRLPTEEEWEYAARYTDGRTFPWGNEDPGSTRSCFSKKAEAGTCEIGAYPAGDSELGFKDMSGNVWEYTSSIYCLYSKPNCVGANHTVKGGSFHMPLAGVVRAPLRSYRSPEVHNAFDGFRCARDAK